MTKPADAAEDAAWWGFGINIEDEHGMAGSDLYMIYKYGTGNNRVVDCYATSNASPITDSNSDISVSEHGTQTDGSFKTTFSRSLNTGEDSQDLLLSEGYEYELLLSYGTITGDVANEHAKKDRTHATITLSNDFSKNFDDSGDDDYSLHLTAFLSILGLLFFMPY